MREISGPEPIDSEVREKIERRARADALEYLLVASKLTKWPKKRPRQVLAETFFIHTNILNPIRSLALKELGIEGSSVGQKIYSETVLETFGVKPEQQVEFVDNS